MAQKYSSRFRIDEKVLFTMIVTSFLALLILAFRFKASEPRLPVKIVVKDSVFVEGALISFSAETNGGKTFEWDFGDGVLSEESTASSATHTYDSAGTYMVTVTVNGKNEDWKKVVVKKAAIVFDTRMLPQFTGPDSAMVNDQVIFTDTTHDATSWEWRFSETGNIETTERSATYMFTTPGPKTVYLKINGKPNRAGTRSIYIKELPQTAQKNKENEEIEGRRRFRPKPLPLPDAPTIDPNIVNEVPEVKKAPEIASDQLESLLRQVVSGEKTAGDFLEYLCGNLNMNVGYNNETKTFSEMCKELRKIEKVKKIKVLKVTQQFRNATNGCIESINVIFKKKGLFG